VPKIPSYKTTDVAHAIAPECKQVVVGIRPGEKLHEEMITASDSFNTWDLGKYYAILPQKTMFNLDEFAAHFNAKRVPEGFNYNSATNDEWETIESLRAQIKEHVDPNFSL
jgi:UDP-N-acetylglucosamine 4,6-dehydratase